MVIQSAVRGFIARRFASRLRSQRDLELRKSRVEDARRRAAVRCIEGAWGRRRRLVGERSASKRAAERRRIEVAEWRKSRREIVEASSAGRAAASGDLRLKLGN